MHGQLCCRRYAAEEERRRMTKPQLPVGYRLEPNIPDFLVLLRPDGSRVGVFHAWSWSKEAVEAAAEEDVQGLSQADERTDDDS